VVPLVPVLLLTGRAVPSFEPPTPTRSPAEPPVAGEQFPA
jgi:hypothetical protein